MYSYEPGKDVTPTEKGNIFDEVSESEETQVSATFLNDNIPTYPRTGTGAWASFIATTLLQARTLEDNSENSHAANLFYPNMGGERNNLNSYIGDQYGLSFFQEQDHQTRSDKDQTRKEKDQSLALDRARFSRRDRGVHWIGIQGQSVPTDLALSMPALMISS